MDHTGVPNAQLIKENNALAALYNYTSVAEQNSIDVGWSLLMDESFQNFRNAIYSNKSEFARFRQLVVQVVLATGAYFNGVYQQCEKDHFLMITYIYRD